MKKWAELIGSVLACLAMGLLGLGYVIGMGKFWWWLVFVWKV